MIQLNFAEEWHYEDNDDGIPIEVSLTYAGITIEVQAKVDPGAAVCLFSNEDGCDLGIPIEQGIPKRLGGLTGSLEAYGHEVTLQTGEIAFQSLSSSPNILVCNATCSDGKAGCEICGSA